MTHLSPLMTPVFSSISLFVTPRFVGGGAAMMGHFIELQFSLGFNWPMGSAMAFTVMAVSLALVMILRGLLRRSLQP